MNLNLYDDAVSQVTKCDLSSSKVVQGYHKQDGGLLKNRLKAPIQKLVWGKLLYTYNCCGAERRLLSGDA